MPLRSAALSARLFASPFALGKGGWRRVPLLQEMLAGKDWFASEDAKMGSSMAGYDGFAK